MSAINKIIPSPERRADTSFNILIAALQRDYFDFSKSRLAAGHKLLPNRKDPFEAWLHSLHLASCPAARPITQSLTFYWHKEGLSGLVGSL